MFQRLGDVQVTVMRVVRRRNEQRKANELLREAIEDLGSDQHTSEVLVSAEPIDTLIERSKDFDLIVLGLGRDADRRRLVGEVARKIAAEASCPLVAIARAK
jgi:nucleotide-binding universal stress UspA family protein